MNKTFSELKKYPNHVLLNLWLVIVFVIMLIPLVGIAVLEHSTGPVRADTLSNTAPAAENITPASSVPSLDDTDVDGCLNVNELGTDWRKGGQRDPYNKWDFFDVPTPAITAASAALPVGDPGRPKFDKVIKANDQVVVTYYLGAFKGGKANVNGVSYDSHYGYQMGLTLDPNFTDGMFYDRTPTTDKWRSAAPNGAISVQDQIVILNQVGTNCAIPPATTNYNLSQPTVTGTTVKFTFSPAITSGSNVGLFVSNSASSGPLPAGTTSWTLNNASLGFYTARLMTLSSGSNTEASNQVSFDVTAF